MDQTLNDPKTSRIRTMLVRAAKAIVRTTLTLAVIAGAVLAVRYGSAELANRAEAAPSPDAAPAIPVSVTPLVREDGYDIRRAFVGQVEAAKTVNVAFELPGLLAEILVDEGDQVTRGQVLARQDTAVLRAERNRLEASKSSTAAQLKFANQTVERSEELRERGFAPQSGLDEALARRDELTGRIAEIDADLANVDILLGKAEITAPFDGRVTTRTVDGGEALSAGQTVVSLVQLGAPQVRVGVPLEFGAANMADVEIELDGVVIPASLISLRPDIDPVTRTRTAIFALDSDIAPTFGQTARLLVTERVSADGVWVPLKSLKEGVRGQWTLLAVDTEQTVRAAQVEILHAETDRVFARTALPDGTPLIDAGPQRVAVGQNVVLNASE
ncbi:MAG: efflux RND transporter periplasmic adaptor subunit [Pseudomonadota bacterium]